MKNKLKSALKSITGKILISIIVWGILLILFSGIIGKFSNEASYIAPQLAFIGTAFIMVVIFEKRQFKNLGISRTRLNSLFYFGTIIGIAISIISVILISFFTNVQIFSNDFNSKTLFYQLCLFFLVALGEELYFRGYIMNLFIKSNKTQLGIIVSTLFFALVHLMNPHSFNRPLEYIILEITNILLLGYVFAITRLSSKGIWMPIGIHFAINFVQSSIFGFINGGKKLDSVVNVNLLEYSIFNGSNYGLESSLSLTIITIVCIYFLKREIGFLKSNI